jgi:signal transduction histidine kinase
VSAQPGTTPTLAALRQTRAQQETALRWLRLLGPVLLIFWLVVSLHGQSGPALGSHRLAGSIALAGFVIGGLGTLATRQRPGAAHLAGTAVLAASSVALLWLEPGGLGIVGLFVAVLMLARRAPQRLAFPLSIAAFVVLAVIAATVGGGAVTLVGVIALGALAGMTYLATRLGETSEQAEQLLVELEQTRAAEARAAGLAERQRLAREMHDVLAHSLSGLMLQLEGARMLAADDPGDPRLPPAIERAHHLGQTGLEEARRAIGMLRDDVLPGPDRLPDLAAQFQADCGIPCQLTVSGEARELGSEARLAVYRVAQEALTNITKHARPERVEVCLAYEPRGTRLTVEDFADGQTPALPADGDGGYGLTGMRERAELLGGQLTTAATPDGFRVELEVPA